MFDQEMLYCNFRIKKENKEKALEKAKTYLWNNHSLPKDILEGELKDISLEDLLSTFIFFEPIENNGDIIGLHYTGCKKRYTQDMVLEEISPFVEKGSYIITRMEDYFIHVYHFDGEDCKIISEEFDYHQIEDILKELNITTKNIYKVYRTNGINLDAYNGFMIACNTMEEALHTHPDPNNTEKYWWSDDESLYNWTTIDYLKVEMIGTTEQYNKSTILLSSYVNG